ncbi:hypothetical protein [Nonomuraea salmonea]|uniref:hypothetical protein n=1 Tax=Nonomuraea salmonea TaxID=46181 RepID=UPI0031EFF43D
MSSTSAVAPGTRLAERFRLEDRVSESDGATLWKAIDEILARPVAVHTFAPRLPTRPRGRHGRPRGQPAHRPPADAGLRRRRGRQVRLRRQRVGHRRVADRPARRRPAGARSCGRADRRGRGGARARPRGPPLPPVPSPLPPGVDDRQHGQGARRRGRRRHVGPDHRPAGARRRRGPRPAAVRGPDRPLAG